jgi:RNA polymerase sigma-70 factor (ECF subfamily)
MNCPTTPPSEHAMVDWDELMQHEGPAVWRTAYRLLRNTADADECFQETFLAALELSNRQPVRNWPALLQRLATSRAIDRIRRVIRRRQIEESADVTLAAGTDGDPAQHAEAAELADTLRFAIGQLPQRQAEVFCLHELAAWSHQQIAEQLGMTVNAVGVVLHRTRQKLEELLKMHNRTLAVTKQRQPREE